MMTSSHLQVAVLQFPGSNCEEETAWSLASVGLKPWIHRWNEPASLLQKAAAVVLPGGFSFQDRVRAGALAGKLPLMEAVVEMASAGKPVLGICNGAQILVEAGLLPGLEGERVEMTLAGNRMTGRSGYYSRWVHLEVKDVAADCLFTQTLKPGDLLPLPVAHAEGRFYTIDQKVSSMLDELVPLAYVDPENQGSSPFPWNPNGSLLSAAGVMNRKGNVLGLMPHPERALWMHQVPPTLDGAWGEERRRFIQARSEGPGWHIFRSLALSLRYLPRSSQQGGVS
ncbi:MAG: phosphoribosylformylglycinamidine synthase I [Candidatus Eisenbacteria bacterium]|uniref:Phosphoribosylformylglycinamidine synthase I n=1 Tax=Eiseniibacteriota bacterium TaxID=2212470 RepID=A0A948W5R0_UNCEI|nr:phosphoribosylformylglycinamidine synthase I [Candidatus Eisenbacteria bacterium]MBU1947783.1 phosphoribosylformylglycinamidine synthase I [Candidatus Eisenbacteria bacterium]MBU2690280.1 phosphoribosylformylglycinamidine synthase I [Candidatus Eisenbacteria bacterium]